MRNSMLWNYNLYYSCNAIKIILIFDIILLKLIYRILLTIHLLFTSFLKIKLINICKIKNMH